MDDIRRDLINGIYQQAAAGDDSDGLHYSSNQNVSSDIIAPPKAATVIGANGCKSTLLVVNDKNHRGPHVA